MDNEDPVPSIVTRYSFLHHVYGIAWHVISNRIFSAVYSFGIISVVCAGHASFILAANGLGFFINDGSMA
jgi:hypothetical protein